MIHKVLNVMAVVIIFAVAVLASHIYTTLPIVQINTEGECVQVLFTDEFGCGFLPDKYITEHVR